MKYKKQLFQTEINYDKVNLEDYTFKLFFNMKIKISKHTRVDQKMLHLALPDLLKIKTLLMDPIFHFYYCYKHYKS